MEGEEAVSKVLADLPVKVRQRFSLTATKAALGVLLVAAKARAPIDSGALRDSLIVTTKRARGQKGILARVGPDAKVAVQVTRVLPNGSLKDEVARPVKYAHLVELGHAPAGHVNIGGNIVGKKPFIRPAFDATKEQIIKLFGERISKLIEKSLQTASAK